MLYHWFANPWALYLLTLLPSLGVLAGIARRRRRRALAQLGYTPLLESLVASRGWLRFIRGGLWLLGVVVLAVGIAGPQWGRDWEQSAAPGRDLVVALDVSRSMFAETPSRLSRAKAALLDLSNTVQQRGGHRLALVVFAAQPKVVVPLTHDYDHFREALEQLDLNQPPPDLLPDARGVSGTRIGRGFAAALMAPDVLLVSDGDDPAGDDEWRVGVEEARRGGVRVHAVGLGEPSAGSPIPSAGGFLVADGRKVLTKLEEKPLQEIARLTGGTYVPAHAKALSLGDWFREVIEPGPAREETNEDALPVYQQRYGWFFGAALGLFALEMVSGPWGRRRRAPNSPASLVAAVYLLLLLAGAGPALLPEVFVRRGNEAFERGEYEAAVDLFTKAEERITDPGLVAFNKATALYRLGRFREAELHYRRCREDATGPRRAQALYGLGNARVQQSLGRDPEALAAALESYTECLRQPDLDAALADDARHNLELAKLLLQKALANKDRLPPDRPPTEDPSRPPHARNDPRQGPDPNTGGAGRASADGSQPGGQPGSEAVRTEQAPAPGTGNLPVVPDKDELVKLPPEDAVAHLEQAAARVLQERREHRQRSVRPPMGGVKDW